MTQEGKRTFGCLVNGEAWVPENGGLFITDPPLKFYYDNINGGEFSIVAQMESVSSDIDQELVSAVNNIVGIRNYTYPVNRNNMGMKYNNYRSNESCITIFSADNGVQTIGYVNISRFDLPNGIISGTFGFTLTKPGCETVKIIDGRFDAKL